ncbi:MAG: hypothetical protein ABSH56_31195 [Bryobacteraceae bacterium]
MSAWRAAREARGLGAVSINVRITAVRKLAVEAADNGLLAPELASGITRVKDLAQARDLARRALRLGGDRSHTGMIMAQWDMLNGVAVRGRVGLGLGFHPRNCLNMG